jgi:DNA-binding HxlR family transcriptional regulator
MQRTSFADMSCSIARTLDVAGEWWTPLVLRSVYLGVNRFDDLQRDLGLSRKVLADRLDTLVGHGVLERRPYQERPLRHEYVLTEKGLELVQAILALVAWGDKWTAGDAGPPVLLRHDRCGHTTHAEVTCAHCGEPLHPAELTPRPGPGGKPGPGTRVSAERLLSARPGSADR